MMRSELIELKNDKKNVAAPTNRSVEPSYSQAAQQAVKVKTKGNAKQTSPTTSETALTSKRSALDHSAKIFEPKSGRNE